MSPVAGNPDHPASQGWPSLSCPLALPPAPPEERLRVQGGRGVCPGTANRHTCPGCWVRGSPAGSRVRSALTQTNGCTNTEGQTLGRNGGGKEGWSHVWVSGRRFTSLMHGCWLLSAVNPAARASLRLAGPWLQPSSREAAPLEMERRRASPLCSRRGAGSCQGGTNLSKESLPLGWKGAFLLRVLLMTGSFSFVLAALCCMKIPASYLDGEEASRAEADGK